MTQHCGDCVPTLFQPYKQLRVVSTDDASNKSSDVLTLPATLALIRLDAGRNIRASRFECQPCGLQVLCRRIALSSQWDVLPGYC